jgi:hypothetical protein
MRIVAVVWIVKGLGSWMIILGTDPMGHSLQSLPPPQRGVVIVFSVLDLVAGVGLWLTSAWGGVMWLFAVMSALIAKLLMPTGVVVEATEIVVSGLLVAAYLAISWLAARDPPSV